MSNKKRTNEARAARDAADSAAVSAINNVKITPEAQGVLAGEYGKYNRIQQGDFSNLPAVQRYLALKGQKRQASERAATTGIAGLAGNYNDSLIQMNRDMLNRQEAQQTSADVAGIVSGEEQQAASNVAGFSGMDLSARSNAASMMLGRTGNFWNNYINERNKPGFWDRFMQGASVASSAISPIRS